MKSLWPSDGILRQLNRVLLAVIIGCNLFVIGTPLLPQVTFTVGNIIAAPDIQTGSQLDAIDRSYSHVVIPRLKLDEKIHEGTDVSTANLGVWRRPNASTPGNNTNTVLVGHRFTYDGESVFYHLDKLRPGDEIIVVYSGEVFVYTAGEQRVVPATAIEIEDPTASELLTIYTCTPIWSAKDRLVITATLERKLEP